MKLSSIPKLFWQALSYVFIVFLFSTIVPYVFVVTCWIITSCMLPETWFHKVEDFFWSVYQRLVVFLFEHYTGVEVYIDGNIPVTNENSLVISNHQATLDWIMADFIAVRQGTSGCLRYVFKNSLKYYPLCGYSFAHHGGVFVRRDGHHQDKKMREVLQTLIKRKASLFLMIYPEGTRFNSNRKDVLKKSQTFALNLGLKQLNQVLTPRVKAFDTALDSLRNYIDAVYDITVIYDDDDYAKTGERGKPPSVAAFLSGRCKRVFLRFRRMPIDDVTGDIDRFREDDSSPASASMRWLHNRFALKDEAIEEFYRAKSSQDASSDPSRQPTTNTRWRRSTLPLSSTLPAFTVAVLLHCALFFPWGRCLYLSTVVFSSTFGILYTHWYY